MFSHVESTKQIVTWFMLQKGDIIDVVQMNKSGLWKGVLHNRIGHFKFINVEILNDRVPRRGEPEGRGKWGQRYRQKPGSVQELLQRMNLQVESNILPRLEQTDSHLHRFECKAGNLAFIRFFISWTSLFSSISNLRPPVPLVSCVHLLYRVQYTAPLKRRVFLFFVDTSLFYIHLFLSILILHHRFHVFSHFLVPPFLLVGVFSDKCVGFFLVNGDMAGVRRFVLASRFKSGTFLRGCYIDF